MTCTTCETKPKRLTKRENEVLSELIKGDLDITIAQRLGICRGMVKLHNSRIYKKLGVTNSKELLAKVISNQKIEIDGLREELAKLRQQLEEKEKLIPNSLKNTKPLPSGADFTRSLVEGKFTGGEIETPIY